MKILVTGGFGFLGGRVARHLASCGHEVVLGTRHSVAPHPGYDFAAKVVRTPWTGDLSHSCDGVDVVVHASGMNAQDCARDPVGAVSINTVATARMLQTAILAGVQRFVFVSTVHVYTDTLEGTVLETDVPTNLHPYATSNRAAEDAVLGACRNAAIDGVVVRFTNGFGVPNHRTVNCWMLLVNDLCRQAVETGRLVLSSNGRQVRNFISMREVCRVMEFLACRVPLTESIGKIGPMNAAGERALTVLEMAKMVRDRCGAILGSSPELVMAATEPQSSPRYLDIRADRLRQLGYSFHDDPIREIDELLTFCRREFTASP